MGRQVPGKRITQLNALFFMLISPYVQLAAYKTKRIKLELHNPRRRNTGSLQAFYMIHARITSIGCFICMGNTLNDSGFYLASQMTMLQLYCDATNT